jgi:hypothetical protein
LKCPCRLGRLDRYDDVAVGTATAVLRRLLLLVEMISPFIAPLPLPLLGTKAGAATLKECDMVSLSPQGAAS